MRTVDDIKAVVYRREDACEPLVRRFLRLPGRQIVELAGDMTLEKAVESLMRQGYASKEVVILKRYRGRLFQRCPCSHGMVRCGYHLVNTAFNCLFDCAYCFLNTYLNAYGIVQFINHEEALEALADYARSETERVIRVGSGEFTDSLMMDSVTGFSAACAAAAERSPGIFFELKTKSADVGHLPARPAGNMVAAWSLNAPRFIDRYEAGAASLEERIDAAADMVKSGYLAAFHFDPIILEGDWREEYRRLVDRLFAAVDPDRVAWVSLGCFRYAPGFREASRDSDGARSLVAAEMFPGPDGKYRYMQRERVAAYGELLDRIRRHGDPFVYLCMETPAVWREVFGLEFDADDALERTFAENLMRRFPRGK